MTGHDDKKVLAVLAAFTTLSVFVVASGSPATASTPADTAVRFPGRGRHPRRHELLVRSLRRGPAALGSRLWLAKALELGPARTVASEDVPAGGNLADAVSAVVREGVTVGLWQRAVAILP